MAYRQFPFLLLLAALLTDCLAGSWADWLTFRLTVGCCRWTVHTTLKNTITYNRMRVLVYTYSLNANVPMYIHTYMHLNICTIVVHTQRLHHHYDHQHRALNKASDNKPNNSETTEAKTAATTNNQQQRTAAATTKVKQKVKQSICKIHMTTVRKWRRTAEPSHTPTTQRRRDAASELRMKIICKKKKYAFNVIYERQSKIKD